jgi:fatty acid desaturase
MAASWDLLLVALAAVHGAALLTMPAAPLIAMGVWWNSNTIAHNFIHRPFFRSRSLNLIFSAGQSVLTGIPQALWRDRHLAHHAGVAWRLRYTPQLVAETALVSALWTLLAVKDSEFLFGIYLPGYLAGLGLCALQGHYEHAGSITSHYGRIYNALCFNDGYHVEHHAFPGVHWRHLPRRAESAARASRWPALLRWLDAVNLDALERLVLRWPRLQQFVLRVHRRAFIALLQELPPFHRVAVVGGGLFPRTAIVLRELVPAAEILVIDANRQHVETARRLVGDSVTFEHAWFSVADASRDFDLVVIPLAFKGDRAAIYQHPPAPAVLVHDWLWRRRGHGRIISLALFKRLNLVQR